MALVVIPGLQMDGASAAKASRNLQKHSKTTVTLGLVPAGWRKVSLLSMDPLDWHLKHWNPVGKQGKFISYLHKSEENLFKQYSKKGKS